MAGGNAWTLWRHELLAFLDLLATDRHLLGVLFVTGQKSNLCTVLTTQNTTENNCIVLHAQNTYSLHLDMLLTGIHWWVVTSKGRPAFPTTNNCQGQLQTPQSLSTCHVIISAVCTKATACDNILSLIAVHVSTRTRFSDSCDGSPHMPIKLQGLNANNPIVIRTHCI